MWCSLILLSHVPQVSVGAVRWSSYVCFWELNVASLQCKLLYLDNQKYPQILFSTLWWLTRLKDTRQTYGVPRPGDECLPCLPILLVCSRKPCSVYWAWLDVAFNLLSLHVVLFEKLRGQHKQSSHNMSIFVKYEMQHSSFPRRIFWAEALLFDKMGIFDCYFHGTNLGVTQTFKFKCIRHFWNSAIQFVMPMLILSLSAKVIRYSTKRMTHIA